MTTERAAAELLNGLTFATAKPGDTILVRLAFAPTPEDIDRVKALLAESSCEVVIFDADTQLAVIPAKP